MLALGAVAIVLGGVVAAALSLGIGWLSFACAYSAWMRLLSRTALTHSFGGGHGSTT